MSFKAIAAIASVVSLSAVSSAYADRTVRLNYYLGPQHIYATSAVEPFAKELTERSNGELTVETYPSEQLGKAADSVRILQSGIADIGWVTFTYHAQEMPATQIVNLPMGLDGTTAAATMWRATQSPGIIKEEWDRLGLVPLMILANPAYEVHSTDKPLPDFASLEGLKLRSPGAAYVETIKRIGAIPYEVATPDQYEALQRGLIDSSIFSFASWGSFKINELLNHTTTGLNVVTTGLGVVTTKEFMDSLTEEEQALLVELGQKYSKIGTEAAAQRNIDALQQYKADGLQIYEWADEDKCLTSAPMGQIWRFEQRRVSGSS
ncbi:TRAP transporter substrate-binding protein [Primorskyibacter flagellatus]|uniref:TRAP-type C4-dicarboxylate transport system, substrate-binding protein n=1 Tax=Primorskyibacter flagellatus TaxID=1387277 RepID=A0A1W2DWT2_9RHOB|nr:TRAP transporter substrate-binding protein DctP [Primorskyibacter flagellatus]SMD01582.1 TRAP-type C4-dicarboxylate transport system, substrate-binding protein [Primorskyibacter flagellatus]